ncbi:MAG TPA: formate dehydrogenase accessory sulfurtransferase FdhD [Tepidisphaeraceae bacterium]|nr:formate dehydrogenase accessory sulfurtransferase FdhD [Tepidisphaeraceae bacterium]
MKVTKWENGAAREEEDELAAEEPLEIRVRGRAISVTMRTPGNDGDDAELAAGFLLTEGMIRSSADVRKIALCPRNEMGNVIDVLLEPEVVVDFDKLTRHVFASSSCGLCGKATIESIQARYPALEAARQAMVDAPTLAALPAIMRATQEQFARTGGLHAAALFDCGGKMLVLREDVGRHNAVDKVLGHALLNDWLPLERHILLVSGRASFEIMQKALAARLPIVAAVSAPSSLAVQFAEESNQTLVGFLRQGRMNVYSGRGRVRM